MGYTHYWTFKKTSRSASLVETKYKQAVKDIAKVVLHAKKNIVNLSGYTAHTEVGQYGGIDFNGVQDEAHENFYLREHFSQGLDFHFCKTAQKEYDVVVVAALIILKFRLGSNIEISSDGDYGDWIAGLELAKHVLKLKSLKIPLPKQEIVNIEDLDLPDNVLIFRNGRRLI